MWHDTVLKADSAFGRLLLGFLNTCSDHPVVTVGFLALMLALAITMWAQMLELRLDAVRTLSERPIRLRHRPQAPSPLSILTSPPADDVGAPS